MAAMSVPWRSAPLHFSIFAVKTENTGWASTEHGYKHIHRLLAGMQASFFRSTIGISTGQTGTHTTKLLVSYIYIHLFIIHKTSILCECLVTTIEKYFIPTNFLHCRLGNCIQLRHQYSLACSGVHDDRQWVNKGLLVM